MTWAVLLLAALAAAGARAQSSAPARTTVERVSLNSGWEFREAGKGEWRRATVPGCVHTDLLANRLIEDPFYGENEKQLQWIGKTDWEYRATFDATPQLLARRHVELLFEGLDTYATVTLNGRPLLEADNMFRTWRAEARPLLRPGRNVLHVRFRSPINEVLPRMKALGYELPAVNDQGEKTSPHTRKAPYQYGWDWGPRFVTSGVWRPVSLEAWDDVRIDNLRVVQRRLDARFAALTVEADVVSDGDREVTFRVETPSAGAASFAREDYKLKRGTRRVFATLGIAAPQLWWPAGMGPQHLYPITAQVRVGRTAKVLDEAATKFGLRTLELRQKPDEWGKSFEFVVNGVPVFAKGGNWIPADSFPTRVTRERYRQLLESVRHANMNMLRVWGGGIYESDDFYDLCDELGLLVWQDFMFACSMYPGDDKFLESVRAEAVDNVRRLRNHPSLALWCGNNEIETAWQHWGWKQNLPARLWDDYKKIFHGVLPEVVAAEDPARAYWPSSPSSNLEDDPDSRKVGDVHYWEVWHASKPFAEYEKQFPRFMSEYGFQSFPSIETVAAYASPEDYDIQSPVMLAHQRHPRGNQLVREYMLREYPEPKDFESFLYVSQVLQAEGIRLGTEHLRRIRPRNMGALYWQVNDCWPVASWSGMDYFGRRKALHFHARRFFSDLLLSPDEQDGELKFYVVSDRTQPASAELRVRLMDFEGRTLDETRKAVEVAPLHSASYLSLRAGDLLTGRDPRKVFLHGALLVAGRTVSTNTHFFRPFKELSLPAARVSAEAAPAPDGFVITLTADKFARAVELSAAGLEGSFSDNYFDLLPGHKAEVTFKTSGRATAEEFRRRLRVRSLTDAFAAR